MRIAGIDAPETHPPRCAHEARLRRQATEQLQALLNSGALTMTRIDRDRDSYGRRGVVRLSRRAGTRIAGGAFVPFATPEGSRP